MLKDAKLSAQPAYGAVAVANEFVAHAAADHIIDLNPAKLHALVYLAHGWHLGVSGHPLLYGRVLAWRDGVYAGELRDAGCWGTKRVEGPVTLVTLNESQGLMTEQVPRLPAACEALKTVNAVWKLYGRLPSFDLVRVTKEPGAPWDLIWNDEERPDDEPKPIPNATLKLFFRELSSRRRSAVGGLSETLRLHPSAGIDQTQPVLERPDPDRLRSI